LYTAPTPPLGVFKYIDDDSPEQIVIGEFVIVGNGGAGITTTVYVTGTVDVQGVVGIPVIV
jgi:hypothetical protein